MSTDKINKWTKISAIGSLLSGIAIIIIVLQVYQANETINQTQKGLEYQKESLILTQNDLNEHERPWIGMVNTDLDYVTFNNGAPPMEADEFLAKQKTEPDTLKKIVAYVFYSVKIQNYGVLPATYGFQSRWSNDTMPGSNDLSQLNATYVLTLMPGQQASTGLDAINYTDYLDAISGNHTWYFIYRADYIYSGARSPSTWQGGYYEVISDITSRNVNVDHEFAK